MAKEDIQKIITAVLLVALLILSFLILRPILLSIILGALLAFIFSPLYNFLQKRIKFKNLSSLIICLLIIIIMVIPFWFLTPPLFNQAVHIYVGIQQTDFTTLISNILPKGVSESFSIQIAGALDSFISKTANELINNLANFVLEIPGILLHLVVVFFTLFFSLRDKEKIFDYFKSLIPLPENMGKNLIKSTKGITSSILYGQILVGMIQGIFVGIGIFLFKIPNALVLTLLALLFGVLPIVGTAVVWVPLAIYLFATGNVWAAIGIIFFGLLSASADNILRPLIVSKRANISPSIILVGMIGGIFFFGILGLILGPLILSYLLIILEVYRKKSAPGLIIEPEKNKK
jgi:predicted PurR-regulated permease PerM